MEKTRLVWDAEKAKRDYDIIRLEAMMMNLETMAMFPDVDGEPPHIPSASGMTEQ